MRALLWPTLLHALYEHPPSLPLMFQGPSSIPTSAATLLGFIYLSLFHRNKFSDTKLQPQGPFNACAQFYHHPVVEVL